MRMLLLAVLLLSSLAAHPADIAISSLPAATSLAGADLFPIVQSGTTKKITATAAFTTVGGTPAVGDIYYVSGAGTALTLPDVAVGAVLCSGGVTTAPTYCNSLIAKGTAPTSSNACGTSPTIVGNDDAFVVTVGTGGTATTCAVTFNVASTTNPRVCSVVNDTDRVPYSTVETTTVITITATAAFTAGSKFKVRCTRWL